VKQDEVVADSLDSETEKSIRLLIEEYLDTQDQEEARQCLGEIQETGIRPHVVKAIIVFAANKKEEVREMLVELITYFLEKSTVSPAQLSAGFRLVLDQLDDISLDAPHIPKILGKFMGSALLDAYLEPSFLVPALMPIAESGFATAVLDGLFNYYVDNTSKGETRDWVMESNIDITPLFKSSERNPRAISAWLQSAILGDVFPSLYAEGKIEEMLDKGEQVDSILGWLGENVPRDILQSGDDFIQRIGHLFIQFVGSRAKSLREPSKLAEEVAKLFEQYSPLLKKLLTESNHQLDCLFAAQRFCNEQNFPEGVLESLFQGLYVNDIVDTEVFTAWAAADTQDLYGKAEALGQLHNWFNSLANGDESSA